MHMTTTKCYNIYLIIKNVSKKIILDFIVPFLQTILKIHNKIVIIYKTKFDYHKMLLFSNKNVKSLCINIEWILNFTYIHI